MSQSDIENPNPKSIADRLRFASDEEMARIMDENFACPPDDKPCYGRGKNCQKCWLDWLKSTGEEADNEESNSDRL